MSQPLVHGRIAATLSLLVLVVSACATTHAPSLPASDHTEIEKLRDAFLARAARGGVTLPFVPEIREWTRPTLISWRAEQHAVAVPRWEELSPDQHALLDQMAPGSAQQIFVWLFRWYLVPHELTHALQDERHSTLGHFAAEQFANDLAAAFLVEDPGNAQRLAQLEKSLGEVAPRLPPPGNADDYERHFADLPLRQYAAYQIFFIRRSLARRATLHLDDLVRMGLNARGSAPKR